MVAAVAETKVSSKGQVVIPKGVRDRLGWRPGDTLLIEEGDDAIVIRLQRSERLTPNDARGSVDALRTAFAGLYRGPPIATADMARLARAAATALPALTHKKPAKSPPPARPATTEQTMTAKKKQNKPHRAASR